MDREEKVQIINNFAGIFREALESIPGKETKDYLIAKWNALCDEYISEEFNDEYYDDEYYDEDE